MGVFCTYFGIAIRPISRFSSAPERSVLQGMPGRFIFHSHIYSDVCNSCFTFPHRSQFSLQHHRLLVIKIILSRIGDLNLNFFKNVYIKYCFRISLINFYSILTQIYLLRYLLINFSKLFFFIFQGNWALSHLGPIRHLLRCSMCASLYRGDNYSGYHGGPHQP